MVTPPMHDGLKRRPRCAARLSTPRGTPSRRRRRRGKRVTATDSTRSAPAVVTPTIGTAARARFANGASSMPSTCGRRRGFIGAAVVESPSSIAASQWISPAERRRDPGGHLRRCRATPCSLTASSRAARPASTAPLSTSRSRSASRTAADSARPARGGRRPRRALPPRRDRDRRARGPDPAQRTRLGRDADPPARAAVGGTDLRRARPGRARETDARRRRRGAHRFRRRPSPRSARRGAERRRPTREHRSRRVSMGRRVPAARVR